ncbi:hypothetical protein F183_A07750 [Bryobacterales bacterium F-183]|nr:hypothetical protein F183_A07750 [Bryobacterales bacterium F-183]
MSNPAKQADNLLHHPDARALSLDLLGMCLDLAGLVDPTPTSDAASAILSLVRGNWLDAAISGVSMVPYVGDLAKAGKFPRYLRTVERAINLARESTVVADALRPVMQRLDQLLDLLPSGSTDVQRLHAKVRQFLTENRVTRVAVRILPDISRHFSYRQFTHRGNTIREASGRLGVPGQVMQHRSSTAQRGVSSGTGDDAGHLIGNRFGASGGPENLSQQNWVQNRGGGTFHDLENEWAASLHGGTGIVARVQDVMRPGETRPFMRRVQWSEVDSAGRITHHERVFANPHSTRSRNAQDIPTEVFPPGHIAQVIDLNAFRASRHQP